MAFSKFPAAALLGVDLGKDFCVPALPFVSAGSGGYCRKTGPVAWRALLPVPCGIWCPESSTWTFSQGVGEEGMHKMLADTPSKSPPILAFCTCTSGTSDSSTGLQPQTGVDIWAAQLLWWKQPQKQSPYKRGQALNFCVLCRCPCNSLEWLLCSLISNTLRFGALSETRWQIQGHGLSTHEILVDLFFSICFLHSVVSRFQRNKA